MNRKSKALKGLLTLSIVIALCMFFSRTVQTITTPKVQRISASRGKLEQKIPLSGSLYFPEVEEVKIKEAQNLGIVIDQVHVRAGYYVKAGDVLFTASTPEYEQKMKEIADKRDEKVYEYANEYAGHIKLRQTSQQNDMYNDMASAIDAYYQARYALSVQALAEGYTLPGDETLWGQISDGSEELQRLSNALGEAEKWRDAAVQKLSDLYNNKIPGVYRVGDTTFEYIKKVEKLRGEIDDLEQEMLALQTLKDTLSVITAPHDGYITAFELKTGDTYDGSKAAYQMTKADGVPVLRADISQVDKNIRAGQKAVLKASGAETEVDKTELTADGKKYVYVKLDSKTLKAAGGMSTLIGAEKIELVLYYRAQKSTTLLPSSAVRADDNGDYYVYIVDQSRSGLLDSAGYKVTKQSVTVLEKSDQIVSLADDLSYREIADREDRALSDGQAVMDYVD